jgi:hypothetical protein
MIYDYYNIICYKCNTRLLDTKNSISNLDLISCHCGEIIFSSRKEKSPFKMYAIYNLTIKNGRLFQTISSNIEYIYDMPHRLISKTYGNIIQINSIKNKRYCIHNTLVFFFTEDEIFNLINKPYLSEAFNEFIKIVKAYNNNLIFI